MRARAVLTFDQRTLSKRPRWPASRRSRGDASPGCGWAMATAGRRRDDGAAVGGGVERGRRESMAASVLLFGFATRRGFRSAFGDLPCSAIFFLDAGIDLFPMDLDLGWRFDPELHLTGSNFEHGDLHRVADPDVLS